MPQIKGAAINGCVIARRFDTWPILEARYRGVCRGRWWPLGDQSKDHQAKALTAAREKELLGSLPSDTKIDSCIDLDYLRSYVQACDRLEIAPLYSLVCQVRGGHTPVDWIEELRGASVRLGIDVTYGSGSYSFINGDFGPDDDEITEFLAEHLNDNGLFNTFDEADAFMAAHQCALERGVNFETLDDAMPIELWEDQELLGLRRRLRA